MPATLRESRDWRDPCRSHSLNRRSVARAFDAACSPLRARCCSPRAARRRRRQAAVDKPTVVVAGRAAQSRPRPSRDRRRNEPAAQDGQSRRLRAARPPRRAAAGSGSRVGADPGGRAARLRPCAHGDADAGLAAAELELEQLTQRISGLPGTARESRDRVPERQAADDARAALDRALAIDPRSRGREQRARHPVARAGEVRGRGAGVSARRSRRIPTHALAHYNLGVLARRVPASAAPRRLEQYEAYQSSLATARQEGRRWLIDLRRRGSATAMTPQSREGGWRMRSLTDARAAGV